MLPARVAPPSDGPFFEPFLDDYALVGELRAWRSPARAARDFSGSTGEPVTGAGATRRHYQSNNYRLGTFLGAGFVRRPFSIPPP
jgi:hypothetical protein